MLYGWLDWYRPTVYEFLIISKSNDHVKIYHFYAYENKDGRYDNMNIKTDKRKRDWLTISAKTEQYRKEFPAIWKNPTAFEIKTKQKWPLNKTYVMQGAQKCQ